MMKRGGSKPGSNAPALGALQLVAADIILRSLLLAFALLALLNLTLLLLTLLRRPVATDSFMVLLATRNTPLAVVVAVAVPVILLTNTVVAYQEPRLRAYLRWQTGFFCLVLLAVLASYAF